MRPAEIERRIVAALRALADDERLGLAQLRSRVSAPLADVRETIARMRYQGKIEWDRLALSPSMRASAAAEAPAPEPKPEAAPTEPEPAPTLPPSVQRSPSGEGPTLLAEVEAWCARTGTDETRFGAVLMRHPGWAALLRKRGTVTAEVVAAARRLMAEHPEGLADAPPRNARVRIPKPPHAAPALAEEVAREAADRLRRRAIARSTGSVRTPVPAPIPNLGLVERIQTELAEGPREIMRALTRRHPELWRRVLLLARAGGETPAAALYRAIEAGLDGLEEQTREVVQ